MPGKKGDFLSQAYGLDGLDDAMAFYDAWADDYDAEMEERLNYVAPRQCAEHFAQYVDDRTAAVLDLGCGTGLTALYLKQLGFETFDGIDITPAMIERSRARGIYRSLIEADLTKPLAISDATYDAAISSGTFTRGHVGAEPIGEIFRVLKPGAVFACTIHRDIWEPKGFAAAFSALRDAGAAETLDVRQGHFFSHLEPAALYCVFRKLA